MQIGTALYKYGNGTEEAKLHLLASEGMVLTADSIELWNCVDVNNIDGWQEIPEPELADEDL